VATTILLARHGETDWNAERRWQGHSDPPLNDRGRTQAGTLADELAAAGVAAVYSSDLRRSVETAQIVAGQLGLAVRTDPRLREVDVGEWSGLTPDEVAVRYPDAHSRWLAYESHGWSSGESYEQLADRVVAALVDIAAGHPDDTILVVTHGGPVRAVSAHCEGVPHLEYRRQHRVLANCAMTTVAVEGATLTRVD
jgi:broad specificity phosphatase PhoE